MSYLNEITVLDFYLELIEADKINFLVGREKYSKAIKCHIEELKRETVIHNKIEISVGLWKTLFEAALSYMDPDKRGYDKLFDYFDKYVSFEELIFASDSFYRDHTMHCLWVYFLGEFMYFNDEFDCILGDYKRRGEVITKYFSFFEEVNEYCGRKVFKESNKIYEILKKLDVYNSSSRCISALTHDLGYPLKKINKINKSIKGILPYFSIKNVDEFNFEYNEVQQMHIQHFIKILSYDFSINAKFRGNDSNETKRLRDIDDKLFVLDEERGFNVDFAYLDTLTDEQLDRFTDTEEVQGELVTCIHDELKFLVDFEEYNHGIMSAYLLVKLVNSFSELKMSYSNPSTIHIDQINRSNFICKQEILKAISDHTSRGFQIEEIDTLSPFLVLMDELEEFSRISRANKNRQYVNEFCKSNIYVEDEHLCVDFTFDNIEISNLDPEFAFKGRCRRFLELFNISELEDSLKIRLRCIGDLPYDKKTYELTIRKKYACITIEGEEQNIPEYLKSTQFYTREEYAVL